MHVVPREQDGGRLPIKLPTNLGHLILNDKGGISVQRNILEMSCHGEDNYVVSPDSCLVSTKPKHGLNIETRSDQTP